VLSPVNGFLATVAPKKLAPYASEMAWRENSGRVSNAEQYLMTTAASLGYPAS
jgi:hypothetical protein